MDDLISRQAAIDDFYNGKVYKKDCTEYEIGYNDGIDYAVSTLSLMPSAQQEPCDDPRADIYYLAEKIGIHRLYALVVELRGEPEPCKDAVSRQAAIDATWFEPSYTDPLNVLTEARDRIEALPSAQPEIIKCKDCMHNGSYDTDCPIDWNGKEYCNFAER